MTDEPTHDDLIEQAERVLSLVEATMYPIAEGETHRLQEMLEAVEGSYDPVYAEAINERGVDPTRLEPLYADIEQEVRDRFDHYDIEPSKVAIDAVAHEMMERAIEFGESDNVDQDFEEHFEQIEEEMAEHGQAARTNVSFVMGALSSREDSPPELREITSAAIAENHEQGPDS